MNDLSDRVRAWWDDDADSYDASAGHALTDPVEAAAWTSALTAFLPPAPAAVLDVGAGTGALSLVAAELGHRVTALDLSEGMLAKARAKAGARGFEIAFVHGPAEHPPAGPFDAVMERHVSWTLPDPVAAFAAWRAVTRTGGRLIVFGGSWGGEGPFVATKDTAARVLRRWSGDRDDHHAPYPDEIVRSLPLGKVTSPAPYVRALREAGWRSIRIARLRDVEWAVERREPWPLGWLSHRPRYALVADA
jgi:SAM-dependent methyltransferase